MKKRTRDKDIGLSRLINKQNHRIVELERAYNSLEIRTGLELAELERRIVWVSENIAFLAIALMVIRIIL